MKIVIIGNGASAIRKKNGDRINNCDKVIRMKQYVTTGFERYVGTKIDIYASKWFSWFDNFKPYNPKIMSHVINVDEFWFMFTNPNHVHTEIDRYTDKYIEFSLKNDTPEKTGDIHAHYKNIDLFNIDESKIRYMTPTIISNLARSLKLSDNICYDKKGKPVIIEPSVGLRTIEMALNLYPGEDIFITGFDCFLESSWYWDSDHIINNDHSYIDEKIYITKLIRQGRITEL